MRFLLTPGFRFAQDFCSDRRFVGSQTEVREVPRGFRGFIGGALLAEGRLELKSQGDARSIERTDRFDLLVGIGGLGMSRK